MELPIYGPKIDLNVVGVSLSQMALTEEIVCTLSFILRVCITCMMQMIYNLNS
jgi:hypothetical protein